MDTNDDMYRNAGNSSPQPTYSALRLPDPVDDERARPLMPIFREEAPRNDEAQPNRFFEGLLYVLPPAILLWLLVTWVISLF